MIVSCKKLWKTLIDKDMKKKDPQISANLSSATIAKLSNGDTVSMSVLMRICAALNADISDIVEFIPNEKGISALA